MHPVFAVAVFVALGGFAESQLERVDPDVEVPSVSVEELERAAEGEHAPRLIDVRLQDVVSHSVISPEPAVAMSGMLRATATAQLDPESNVMVCPQLSVSKRRIGVALPSAAMRKRPSGDTASGR